MTSFRALYGLSVGRSEAPLFTMRVCHSLDVIGHVIFVVSSPSQHKPHAEDEEEDEAKH